MDRLSWLLLALLVAAPASGQNRIDLIVDAEGVRRTGSNESFTPNTTRFEPEFSTGGGLGVGLNFFFGDRLSLETKVAVLQSSLRVRTTGTDVQAIANLGNARFYPISALFQWHMLERGAVRPYLGVGVAHIILPNIDQSISSTGASGIKFKDPTGLVIDGGLELNLSKRWSVVGDARYVPMETTSRAQFVGTTSTSTLHIRPLVLSAGLAWHF